MGHRTINITSDNRFVSIVVNLNDDDIVYFNGEKNKVKEIKNLNINSCNFCFTIISD